VVKTALKFEGEGYAAASRDLTGMEYTFQAIGAFYNNFLNCLNDQNATVTTAETIRNVDHLIFQLETFVITGIELNFQKASESLGIVFGEKTGNVISQIKEQCVEEFSSIKENLVSIRQNFLDIAQEGGTISIESINATLNMEAFNNMITAFKDIEVSTKQCSSVVSSFVSVSTSLDKVTASISMVKEAATSEITKGDYNLDVSVQASKKMFATKTLALQNDCENAFGDFQIIAAQMFSGDEEIFEARTSAERFIIEIKTIFDESSNKFQSFYGVLWKSHDIHRRFGFD
jgi:hypothetical protein